MSARLPPPRPGELAPETRELLALTAAPGQGSPATVAALAHSPELLAPFLTWAAAVALRGALPARAHEVLALRAAWNCRSAFEWGEHAAFARRAGLSDAEIAAVTLGHRAAPGPVDWEPHEAVLLDVADQLHESCLITEPTWLVLARHYEPAALVEILYVVGQYTMLSMVANGLRLDAAAGAERLPPVA